MFPAYSTQSRSAEKNYWRLSIPTVSTPTSFLSASFKIKMSKPTDNLKVVGTIAPLIVADMMKLSPPRHRTVAVLPYSPVDVDSFVTPSLSTITSTCNTTKPYPTIRHGKYYITLNGSKEGII